MAQTVRVRASRLTTAIVLAPLLAVALVSFLLVRGQQGSGVILLSQQRAAHPLTPAQVDFVVRAAPDPVGGEKALSARCLPLGAGALHNPWRCVLRYPTGRVIQYTVNLRTDGSYTGDQELVLAPAPRHHDTGRITGCCVAVP